MVGTGVSATYDYDGHGRRTLITEPGAPRRIQMYHQGGLLLAEIGVNTSDTVVELKNYVYQGRNPIAERLRTPTTDVINYVHSDHLGSPMARSGAAGNVYERTLYEPYGLKVLSEPNPPYGPAGLFPDGMGFAGHRVDRVSGLSYMQQRYYDPLAGRFISMDPVTADSGALFNRYAYANNNPIAFVDPDGLLVRAFYSVTNTSLLVVDLDTRNAAFVQANSGGKPWGDPIPPGSYSILHHGHRPGFYRLERIDAEYGDDATPEGRGEFRLHGEGRTTGCIEVCTDKDHGAVQQVLDKTSTTSSDVNSKSLKARLLGGIKESLKTYGNLQVLSEGSTIQLNESSGEVSLTISPTGTRIRSRHHICTFNKERTNCN